MTLIRKIKRFLDHTVLDKTFRYTFHYIYKCKNTFLQKKRVKTVNDVVIFCYGGMGDIIMTFPMITQLCRKFNVHVFIENKFNQLSTLLPENCYFYYYSKKNLFSTLLGFRKKKIPNLLFIQKSPIFELVLFKKIMNVSATIGFLYSHNYVNTLNLPQLSIKKKIINKLSGYEIIFQQIMRLSDPNFNPTKLYKKNNIFLTNKDFNLNFKYFTVSVSKDSNWEMGSIEPKEYYKIISEIYMRTKLTPVFLGKSEDSSKIHEVLSLIPKNFNYINLVGKTNLIDLIAIINKTEFTIANDNGIHHLSNLLKKKTITLFNFSSPLVYKWNNKNSLTLFKKKYTCMPCISKPKGPWDNIPFKCPYNIRCKDSLNAEDIINVFSKLKSSG